MGSDKKILIFLWVYGILSVAAVARSFYLEVKIEQLWKEAADRGYAEQWRTPSGTDVYRWKTKGDDGTE